MSNTIIKIKRSDVTESPPSLESGELAYSFLSGKLFIGDLSNSAIQIGGENILYGAGDVSIQPVESIAAIKQLNTTIIKYAYLSVEGRYGIFVWQSGDYSTQIAADTSEGIYIKADAIASNQGAWVRSYSGTVNVSWFGATGDGVTDDTTALQAAISMTTSREKLIFPYGIYRFTTPLAISGIDVDFQQSILDYDGDPGFFALTLTSNAGGGTTQLSGNRFENFTLRQNDFSNFVTYTGSKTYDPPSLTSFSNCTNITPNAHTTTVTVVGARAGGFCRATFTSLVDGVTLSARVTADDEVTVYFNNYVASAIDMPSGTLEVTCYNNAYHGLCLGGPLGILSNAKIAGFTGVNMAMGDDICQITGVDFSGGGQCYYWQIQANISIGQGWGLVIRPRNNENSLKISTFTANYFGDYRAVCFNQIVVSGLSNNFEMLSMEASSAEESLVLTDAANTTTASKVVYYENNPSWPAVPAPYFAARTYSSGNKMTFRGPSVFAPILDEGVANDLQMEAGFYINGGRLVSPVYGANWITNGDFLNGSVGWSDFSSGSPSLTIPGSGYASGNRVRIDLTSGRPNLQQALETVGKFNIAALSGQNITAGAWIKTNLNGMALRVGGLYRAIVPNDEEWYYSSIILKIAPGTTSLAIAIIDVLALTQTGYFEASDITLVWGDRGIPFVPIPTQPSGSKTFNPTSLTSGSRESTTITVSGAALGDYVTSLSFSNDLQGVNLWGYVSAADTVTAIFENGTVSTIDLGSGTLRAVVQKPL